MHPAPSHLADMTTAELGDYLYELHMIAPANRWVRDRRERIRAILADRAGLIAADHPQFWTADELIAAARRNA